MLAIEKQHILVNQGDAGRPFFGHRAGFTMLEILMVVVIMGVVVQGIFSAFYVGDRNWNVDMGVLDLHQQVRGAMRGMTTELRQGSASGVTVSGNGTRVDFSVGSNNVSYYLSGIQIIREHPTNTTRVLGNNIITLQFALSGNTVEIQINATKTVRQRNLTTSLLEKVSLRN